MSRDYDYYEANAASIGLEEITSSERNKRILQRLRDGKYCITLDISDGLYSDLHYLGWLGYFVGKSESLRRLEIERSYDDEDEGREQRIIHALSDGIARNQSIQYVRVSGLSGDGYATIARALGNLTQLESLTLLLFGTDIDDAGVAAFAHGLRNIGSSLKLLNLSGNSFGSEGLSALAAALVNSTSLEELHLSYNDFSMAAAGLGSLSDWLQTAAVDTLCLKYCEINDEGLQALSKDAINNCEDLDLTCNNITGFGFRHLSNSLQSESCRLEYLRLGNMDIGDDGTEVLARGLVGNKALRALYFFGDYDTDFPFSHAGWAAFSTVLCNTSTVNDTYLSNHTVQELSDGVWEEFDSNIDEDVVLYLRLNEVHPQHAARCKILMNHNHLNMAPFLQWGLKCLPLAVSWFERAKPCTTLSIHYHDERRILKESDEEFESRVLTALYEFVRGVPKKVLQRRDQLILMAAYDDKIARLEVGNERLREDVEQRDRKIAQLEEDNKRLRGVVKSARRALDIEGVE